MSRETDSRPIPSPTNARSESDSHKRTGKQLTASKITRLRSENPFLAASRIDAPMDRGSLGLKCGLEIHQQLDTTKLFCNDRSELMENVKQEFRRRLRPTQSELGEVDAAAVEEAKRNLAFVYQATPNSCPVG